MRMSVGAVALVLVLVSCTKSSVPGPQVLNVALPSHAGDKMCSVSYHASGNQTTAVVTSLIAGKLEILSSSAGGADEETRTLAGPDTITVRVNGNPLIVLNVTLAATAGKYTCSVRPAS